MIPLEKLHAITTAIVHAECPDGLASALLIKDALPDVQIRLVQYNTPAHRELVAEPGLLFADFSPPADRAQEFVDAGALIMDHHKTARPVVMAFGENGVFGDEVTEPGVCGATLVYRHFWLPLLLAKGEDYIDPDLRIFVERFAHLAGIRDTWQNKHPDWYAACVQASALFFSNHEEILLAGLESVYQNWEGTYIWAGKISHDRHLKRCQRAAQEGWKHVSIKGTRVVAFQGVKLSSEAAEAIGDGADLVVGFDVFSQNGVPRYVFSMRSHTTFDCGSFAKRFGGGGHTQAAGFHVDEPEHNPYTTLRHYLGIYEEG